MSPPQTPTLSEGRLVTNLLAEGVLHSDRTGQGATGSGCGQRPPRAMPASAMPAATLTFSDSVSEVIGIRAT